ncbi:MAG: PAS domain S-box protein, partial [Armatimonadota bacterium]|nr:PAS domain S-box protein [Armatimonadota bacterium]
MRRVSAGGEASNVWRISTVPIVVNGERMALVAAEDVTRYVEAELALRESEQRFRALFEYSPDAVFLTRPDGRIDQANPAACAMFGMTEAELIAAGRDGILDWEDPRVPLAMEERGRTGKVVACPLTFIRKGGERFVGETTSFILPGEEPRAFAVVRDVTDRERAAEALRESERNFRLLVESAPQAIFIQTGGRFAYVNPATVALFGARSPHELLGTPVLDRVHPEDRERARERVRLANEERVPLPPAEVRYLKLDGTVFYVETSAVPFRYRGEEGALVFARDVSGRRHAAEALRASEQHFRELWEQMPVAYQSLDPDGRILEVNDAWLAELGYSREEVIGRWFGDFLPDEWPALFRERFERFKADGSVRGVEFPMRRKDGAVIGALFEGRVFYDATGRVARTHCVFVNVTERRQAEVAQRESEARLREVLRHARCILWVGEITVPAGWSGAADGAGKLSWEISFQPDEESAQAMVPLEVPEGSTYGEAFWKSHPKEDQEAMSRRAELALVRAEEGYSQEYRCVDRYGRTHWLREEVSLKPAGPARWRAFGVCVEVTQLKRAELILRTRAELADLRQHGSLDDLLKVALERAETLADSAIGFFHFVAADQETITLQTFSARTLDGACTVKVETRHYPISQAGVWADCIRQRRPIIYNDYAALPHKRGWPDGHAQVTRLVAVPVFRDGLVLGVMGVGNKPGDYTEEDVRAVEEIASLVLEHVVSKRAEDALRESEERFRMLVENAADGISMSREVKVTRPDGTVVNARQLVWGNDRWVEMSGYTREQLEQCPNLRDLIVVRSTPEERALAGARRAAGLSYRGVSSWKRPDGKENYYEWVAVPFQHDGVQYSFGIDRDITDRVQWERRQRARLAVTSVLAAAASQQTAAEGGLRALGQALGWSVAAFWMENPKNGQPETRAVWHEKEEAVARFADAFLAQSQEDAASIYRLVRNSGARLV